MRLVAALDEVWRGGFQKGLPQHEDKFVLILKRIDAPPWRKHLIIC